MKDKRCKKSQTLHGDATRCDALQRSTAHRLNVACPPASPLPAEAQGGEISPVKVPQSCLPPEFVAFLKQQGFSWRVCSVDEAQKWLQKVASSTNLPEPRLSEQFRQVYLQTPIFYLWVFVAAHYLSILERLVEIRRTLLTAPLPEGSAKERLVVLRVRRKVLKKVDAEIGRMLALLLRCIPRGISRKQTRILRPIAVFLQTLVGIMWKGRLQLKAIEDWLRDFTAYLEFKQRMLKVFNEFRRLELVLRIRTVMRGLRISNRDPPYEKPADEATTPSSVWKNLAVPRAVRAPNPAPPLGVAAGR